MRAGLRAGRGACAGLGVGFAIGVGVEDDGAAQHVEHVHPRRRRLEVHLPATLPRPRVALNASNAAHSHTGPGTAPADRRTRHAPRCLNSGPGTHASGAARCAGGGPRTRAAQACLAGGARRRVRRVRGAVTHRRAVCRVWLRPRALRLGGSRRPRPRETPGPPGPETWEAPRMVDGLEAARACCSCPASLRVSAAARASLVADASKAPRPTGKAWAAAVLQAAA